MPLYKFAMVTDNEVFLVMMVDTDDPNFPQSERIAMGMKSEPTVVEITDYPDVVTVGDQWDGVKFTTPPTM